MCSIVRLIAIRIIVYSLVLYAHFLLSIRNKLRFSPFGFGATNISFVLVVVHVFLSVSKFID